MTRQYRITTQNIHPQTEGDCFLEATDPIHTLKVSSIMGGLGSSARLAEYNELTTQKNTSAYFTQVALAQAQGIRPGSPAWNAMFSK